MWKWVACFNSASKLGDNCFVPSEKLYIASILLLILLYLDVFIKHRSLDRVFKFI